MSSIHQFTVSTPRCLPVIVLADISGSMSAEGKIAALNQSMRDMIGALAEEESLRVAITLAVITFGGTVRLHLAFQPARGVQWQDMQADGGTPMGEAMRLAAELIDDREQIPGRSYRPTVILVSDGLPTDDWRPGLERLTHQGRAQKADRLALAIGADADEAMLQEFLGDPEKRVFHAADARRIQEFFRFVTMTVAMRSRSIDPNLIPRLDDPFTKGGF